MVLVLKIWYTWPPHVDSNLHFCYLNVQFIRNKTADFVDFVHEYSLDIHVVAISETWLKPGDDWIITEITPPGYSFHHIPRLHKTGGGVGLLYKSSLSVSIKSDAGDYSSFESIHAEITCNSRSVRLVNVYRSGKNKSGQHVSMNTFLCEFENMIEFYLLHSSDIIFTGDFNIHVDNPSDSVSNQFKSMLSSYGFVQHITEPTHRSGHCLDLLITRDENSLISDVNIHPGLSDHCAIMSTFHLDKPPSPTVSITSRRLKGIDIDVFRQDVASALSQINIENTDLNSCVDKYQSILGGLLDKHAPLRTRTVKAPTNSPWFNEEICTARRIRRKLERKWRCSKLEVYRQNYCVQRRIVTDCIVRAKITYMYYSSQVDGCSDDQKNV